MSEAFDLRQRFVRPQLPIVCVQGLGFVGTAMAIATACARDSSGQPCFNVVGVDLPNAAGRAKIDAIEAGQLPLASTDEALQQAFQECLRAGNLIATDDARAYSLAQVVVVDVHLDVTFPADGGEPHVNFEPFRAAIGTLGRHMQPGSLVLVETTVPPGTCDRVVAPALAEALAARGLPPDSLLLAHSYERVMPGKDYLNSLINFWRVYSGTTAPAADKCEQFLSAVVNVAKFPLVRLASTLASETAKVLENSYRATNIAFIEEWGRFAESAGIDLFAVLEAIRMRPTHNNIRQPGFGVGGYCLTKDPALAMISARQLLSRPDLDFPFCRLAMQTNARMPLVSVDHLRRLFGGSLRGRRVLLLGVSYRQDVGDTRYSPSETFVLAAEGEGASVSAHDPLVRDWVELGRQLPAALPDPAGFDAIVFAVSHREYEQLDLIQWLGKSSAMVLDANRVLTPAQIAGLHAARHTIYCIGRGDL